MLLVHPLLRPRNPSYIKEEPVKRIRLDASLPSHAEVAVMCMEAFDLRVAEVKNQRALFRDEREYVAHARKLLRNKELVINQKEKSDAVNGKDGGRLFDKMQWRIDALCVERKEKDAEIEELNKCLSIQHNAYTRLLADNIGLQQELHIMRSNNSCLLFANANLLKNGLK